MHPDLDRIVERHLCAEDRTPAPEHTLTAYRWLCATLDAAPRPLVLDSGCGTGSGTEALARAHPEAWVLGVDQSVHRLRKGPGRGGLRAGLAKKDNLLLMRADAPSLWRLLARDGRRVAQHYLLYPNPWPKKRHVMRRWPAHPALASLLDLGGALELRTNWSVYAEEMERALRVAERTRGLSMSVAREAYAPEAPLTKFEAKYLASGHPLLRVRATWGPAA